MGPSAAALRTGVEHLIESWRRDGMPGRGRLLAQADALERSAGGTGLWSPKPTLVTATVDDGIGQGIALIGRFAEAVGIRQVFAGLLQSAERVLETARHAGAEMVGLTVLQLDSEPVLAQIARCLPAGTDLVAGGPAFRLDSEMAERAGVGFVAADLTDFLEFLLDWTPHDGTRRR